MPTENELAQQALQTILDRDFPKGKRRTMKAFTLGWKARINGLSSRCPYTDHRTDDGKVTFSRAYQRAWLRGYEAAKAYESTRLKYFTERRIAWLREGIEGTPDQCRTRAITIGDFCPDWTQPIEAINTQAKEHLQMELADLERHEAIKQRMGWG